MSIQAPDRSNAVQAVWAWMLLQLAVGLMEHWATSTQASQVSTSAHILALCLLLFMLAAVHVRLCHAAYICGTAEFHVVVCTVMHRAHVTGNVRVTHLVVQLPNTAHAVHLSANSLL